MPLTLDEMAETKKTLTLEEMAGEERPIDMMPYILNLGAGEYERIEDRLPADDRDRFRQIIELADDPNEERRRIGNILYFSNLFNEPPYIIDSYLNEIMKTTKFDPMKEGPKLIQEAAKHGYSQLELRMVKGLAGIAKIEAEVGGRLRTWFWDKLGRDKPEYQKKMDATLMEWSDMMLNAIEVYQSEHPEEAVRLPLQAGYLETLRTYITNPAVLLQSLIESAGMVMEGVLGTTIGGPAGGITLMAYPIIGETYVDARKEKTEPLPALAQAMLTGTGEAAIEQWTLSKKLGLFKNIRKLISDGLPRLMWEGGKAFFRGTAEEGSQEFNRNFWRWVFTNRSQKWSENIAQSMGAGGIMEAVMAGGFSAIGMIGTPVSNQEKLNRVEKIREIFENADLSAEHQAEINGELDKVIREINDGVYEMTEEEVKAIQREIVNDVVPGAIKEAPEVVEKPPKIPPEAPRMPPEVITPEKPPTVPIEPTIETIIRTEAKSHVERASELEVVKAIVPKEQIPRLNLKAEEWSEKWQMATTEFMRVHPELSIEQQKEVVESAFLGVDETTFEGGGKLAKELHDKYLLPASREYIESKIPAEPTVEKPAEVKKAPKELLGGVAKKPPGLTKAEVEHLGKREQEALRAAQAKGYPVGYKKGVAETLTEARKSLDAFRIKEAISQKGKMDVANVVLTYVPKEKHGDYIRRILQAKTQKRIERLTEAIDKYLDKYEKRQAVKGFKKFVKDIKKKYRRGEVALGYLPKKISDKIVDVLDKFDLAKISEKKGETLESRLEFVIRISGELAEGFEQLNADLDKDATDLLLMGTRRIEELKRLSQKYIGDLDVDEIRYIQASLEHLIKINDLKAQSKERRRIETLRTHINKARQEVSAPKEEVVELTGILGAVKWVMVEGQSTIRTLVGLATGKDNASNTHLLIEELNKANVKRKETYKDFIMYFRKLAERRGIKWSDIKDLNKFTKITIGGKELEVDYDALLSIYAHTQAEGNLRRLLKTRGLNITIYKRDEHGIFTKKHIYRVKRPTLTELRTISELVPEKHKKILDIYFKSNWEKQAPAINETSMAYQNYELARQEKYYHVSREIERAVEGRKADLSISIDQQSRALPRTGGNARINIKSFTHEVMDNMQWSAAYHAMTIPMESARTLVANIKWREAMKKAGQQKALKEITTMLRRTQGLIADQSVVELTASKMLGTIGKSILSLRFSGSLVQTASVPAAIEFINKKYLTQVDIPKPSDIKHLKEISPVLWMRWEAKQFDYALGMVGAQNAFETLLFDHRGVTDKFLFPYTAGDEVAITKLFMAAEKQIEAETKLKRGTNEFQKASLDLLYRAMNTQPQWDMIHRSPLTSDPSVLARSITMFMSARNAQYNVLIRAIDDYRKGRITKAQLSERLAGVGMANLLVSLARHTFKTAVKAGAIAALVAMGIRKLPDDKEIQAEAERLAKKIPLETVFNLIGLNVLGTFFTGIGYAALKTRKYGWGMSRYGDIRTGNMMADLYLDGMQMGIDFVLFTDQLISGEKYKTGKNRGRYKWEITGKRLIDDIALLIAYRFGLPYEGIKSDIVWPTQAALREGQTESAQPIKRK